ncbi:hypothetical protein [Legionella spiritensis]|uniref:hypothetical protein n=1 Tax=Legionella spiritensis TaxID=452 RepID=UPI000F6EB1AD|nr:hypothetical protein [Legionella spiritensis]VEG91775.1 Uncharacterised protein [Legionella spiritensis]
MNDVCSGKEKTITFHFSCNKNKQKLLVLILLNYGCLDLQTLANTIGAPVAKLLSVMNGDSFLESDTGVRLAELFLVLFGT